MTTQTEKEQVIRGIYYDESGFDGINVTYQKAKKARSSSTLNDVKTFMNKQSILQKKDYSSFSSYVTDEPLHEIQFDLADFTKSASDNNGFRYLMVGIDVFSKFAHAVPVKTKQIEESINAFNEIIKHIGVPKQIMMDSEGAW